MNDKKQATDIWIKLMAIGAKSGCHQRAERSFFIKNYQYPVCARCMGMHIGYLIAGVAAFSYIIPVWICIGLCLIMFTDWLIQYIKIKESNNIRRLLTGIMGGYGVLTLEINILILIIDFIYKI